MSDPLGVTASIIAVIQLTAQATKYLKDVKGGATDRTRVRDEIRSVTCLLEMLRDRVEDLGGSGDGDTSQPASIASIIGPNGPLELFKSTLEDIVAKLAPQDRLRRLAQPFKWPFDKNDIAELLARLERLKTHFTLVLQNDLVALAKMTHETLSMIGERLGDLDTARRDEETEKILLWISPISFRSKQADMIEGVQAGTGRWLLQDEVFLGWVRGDSNTLWCPGMPGAGKTRLVSLIVGFLDNQNVSPERPFAYIYCDYSQRASQTPLALVASLLAQVLRRTSSGGLPTEVLSFYALHKKHGTVPTLKQLTDIFRQVCLPCQCIHVIIDALDECALSADSALELITAVRALGPNIRLLCTSRFSTTFEAFFSDSTRIEIFARAEDMRLFLEAQMQNQSRLARHIRADPGLREEIVTTVIEEARGMFLLAALHLESLSKKINRRDIRSSLRTLPKTLDATYEQAMCRIQSQGEEDVELAETVISWILCAPRPLTIVELQHMYATRLLLSEDGEAVSLEDDDLPDSEILTDVCGGLIAVEGNSKSVRLVHYTAQQYFAQAYHDRLPGTRSDMTKISLAYLQLLNFSSGISTSDDAMAQRLDKFPFLVYAARHWGSEVDDVNFDDLWEYMKRFLSNQAAVDVASQVRSLPRHRFEQWSQEFPRDVPALALAASFDLPGALQRLVTEGHDIEGRGSDGETPLIRAASLGHAKNVSVLLQLRADVNAADVAGETALERASSAGKAAAVKALLGGGADIRIKAAAGAGWTVLMSAVSSGSVEVVRMLVEAGADLAAQTVWGDSALSLATLGGQEAIANYLADSGARLPANPAGRRASILASRKGLQTLVRRLTGIANYEAVVQAGLQRQGPAAMERLACVAEVDGEQPVDYDGDRIQDSSTTTGFFESLGGVLDGLKYRRGFLRRYNIQDGIGKGHSSKVFACRSKATAVRYAVKIFNQADWRRYAEEIRCEIRCLTELRHPSIVSLIEVMVSDNMDQLYLVAELVKGGDLFDFIVTHDKLSESTTRAIFSQLFSALAFIHQQGWVHRDIKPENILMKQGLAIKLTDFGLAKKLSEQPGEVAHELCGTPSYVAPEILMPHRDRIYSYSVDIWSAGVVLYICLSGFPPFSDEMTSVEFPFSLSEQIRNAKYNYPSPYWDEIGDPALYLIDGMLVVDPGQRYSIEQCLQNPWMVGRGATETAIDASVGEGENLTVTSSGIESRSSFSSYVFANIGIR